MSRGFKRFYQVDSHPSHRAPGSISDSNFNFIITIPPMPDIDQKSLQVVVTKASVPKSYDNVVAGRNTFTLTETKLGVNTDIKITVPIATYDFNNFKTRLQSLLNAATVNGYVYTVVFDSLTGRYTITCNAGVGAASITTPAAVGFGIHSLLGMAAESTSAMPFTSPNKVFFQLTATVQLRSDIVSANDNVLVPIYAAETPYNTSVVYQASDLDVLAKPLSGHGNGVYNFYVTDVDGQQLDLNGGTVAFEICIYTPLESVLRNFIRMRTLQALQIAEPSEEEVKQLAEKVRQERAALAPPPLAAGVAPAALPPVTLLGAPAADGAAPAPEEPQIIDNYTDDKGRDPPVIPDDDEDLVLVSKPVKRAPLPPVELLDEPFAPPAAVAAPPPAAK